MSKPSEVARDLRISTGYSDGGTFNCPVNTLEIARLAGVATTTVPAHWMDVRHSSVLYRSDEDQKPWLVVNGQRSKRSQRITIAFSLGHFLLHRDEREIGYVEKHGFFDSKIDTSDEATWIARFAGELIMPEAGVLGKYAEGWKVTDIADRYDVDLEVLLVRMNQLGLTQYITEGHS